MHLSGPAVCYQGLLWLTDYIIVAYMITISESCSMDQSSPQGQEWFQFRHLVRVDILMAWGSIINGNGSELDCRQEALPAAKPSQTHANQSSIIIILILYNVGPGMAWAIFRARRHEVQDASMPLGLHMRLVQKFLPVSVQSLILMILISQVRGSVLYVLQPVIQGRNILFKMDEAEVIESIFSMKFAKATRWCWASEPGGVQGRFMVVMAVFATMLHRQKKTCLVRMSH